MHSGFPSVQGRAGELGEAGPLGEPGIPVSIHSPHAHPESTDPADTLPPPRPHSQGDVGVPGERGEAGHRGSAVSGERAWVGTGVEPPPHDPVSVWAVVVFGMHQGAEPMSPRRW